MNAVAQASSNNHNLDAIETFKQRNIERNLKAVFKDAPSENRLPPRVPTPPQAKDFIESDEEEQENQMEEVAEAQDDSGSQEQQQEEEEQFHHELEDFENMGHVVNL